LLLFEFFVIINIQIVLNEILIFQVWEIVARSEPHPEIDIVEGGVLIRLTPKIPDDCPPLLRQIMQMCWKQKPEERPVSFLDFLLFLSSKF
jgi:hypothetical protein